MSGGVILENHGAGREGPHSAKPGMSNHTLLIGGVVAVVLILMLTKKGGGGATQISGGASAVDAQMYQAQVAAYAQNQQLASQDRKAALDAAQGLLSLQNDQTYRMSTLSEQSKLGNRQLDIAAQTQKDNAANTALSIQSNERVGMAGVSAQREVGMAGIAMQKDLGMAQIGAARQANDNNFALGKLQIQTADKLQSKQMDYSYDLGKINLSNALTLGTQKQANELQLGLAQNATQQAKNQNDYQLGMAENDTKANNGILGFVGGIIGGVLGIFGI